MWDVRHLSWEPRAGAYHIAPLRQNPAAFAISRNGNAGRPLPFVAPLAALRALAFGANAIHFLADLARGGAKRGVGPVAAIDEAALIRFAVASPYERLVAILEVVAPDEERVPKRAFHEARVGAAALRLVAHGAEASPEHSAVHAAEMLPSPAIS